MYRKRRGRKPKKDVQETEEHFIELYHLDEGMMLYRPSSSVMPSRPLRAPLEAPVIAPVKKEIEEDKDEAESHHFSILDADTECETVETSQMVDAPNSKVPRETASDVNAPRIKIETEPLDHVSDDIEPALDNNNVESSQINKKTLPERNEISMECNEDVRVESQEKNVCCQNTLALWDLKEMFADSESVFTGQNAEEQSQYSHSQFTNFHYLDFCLDLKKTDVEEFLGYLNSSFPTIKKNPLFDLEVHSRKKNKSSAIHSKQAVSVKYDFSPEALKFVSEVSNSPSVSSDLREPSTSQFFQSNAPHQRISEFDYSGVKEIVNIKKEPVFSKMSESYRHLVDAAKENSSIKSNSDVPEIQSVSQPDSSKIVFEVSVAQKESLKTSVHSASEEIVSDVERDISSDSLKKILEFSNLLSISSDLPKPSNSQFFQSNATHQRISEFDYSGVKNPVNIKEPGSPEKSEPYRHLVDVGKENTNIKGNSVVPEIQSVSQPVSPKVVPEVSITTTKSLKATVHSASEKTVSMVECEIFTESLEKNIEVSNLPSVSSDLSGQSNFQLFQSNAPHQQIYKFDCSGVKETVNIKKEPVSPKKERTLHRFS